MNEPNGFMVRLIDGPFAGKEIHLKPGSEDPADDIVVSKTQYVGNGIVYCFDLGSRELLAGDQVYKVRNRSELPPDLSNRSVMRGAEYVYVGEAVYE